MTGEITGLSRDTLAVLPETRHIAQSIADILSTPRGTRVMRRDYGSDLPLLLDQPINGETLVDLYAATAEAIARWEPRFALRRVEVPEAGPAGRVGLILVGEVAGRPARVEVDL